MENTKTPTREHGKLCYIEIPALDVQQSSKFYSDVFGWKTRIRSDGSLAFDDSVGEVSGSFVLGRKPAAEPGFMIYVWVDDVAAMIERVIHYGGVLTQPIGGDAPEITARFRDPADNIIGLYQPPIATK